MPRLIRYLSIYGLWLLDLGLALWLLLITRTAYLNIFALYSRPGAWVYANRVQLADKFFLLILGVGWLIFMIATESYFRSGVARAEVFKRFARVTGPALLLVFGVDLLLLWLQGGGKWWRWLIPAAELGLGSLLIGYLRSRQKSKSMEEIPT